MFGIGDNQHQTNDDPVMLDNVKQLVDDPTATDDTTQAPPANPVAPVPTPTPIAVPHADSVEEAQNAHAEPAQGFSSSPLPDKPKVEETPSAEEDKPEETKETTPASEVPAPTTTPAATDEKAEDEATAPTENENVNVEHLAGLKQEALGHLEPLVEHLGGSPEEVFKTTMMMIQANDNHKLIGKALESAKKIGDDKVRAKAMLDIINEINYFSQGSKIK